MSVNLLKWYLKFKLFKMNWLRPNWKKLCAGAAVGVILIAIWVALNSHRRYFYIDMQGNKGVAIDCREERYGLICEREFGGKIKVNEY